MKIDIFATCYNEEIMLLYFIRHYKKFSSNITIYDNHSTDDSVKIMKEEGVNVIPFGTNDQFEEQVLIDIRNSCWRESDADWVIVCDIDELVYHVDLVKFLKETEATHIVTEGFEMVSEELPTTEGQIYDEINLGMLKPAYSKPCLFKPKEVTNINFAPGSHTASPEGNVISLNDTGIKLLHYKYINRDLLIKKYAHYAVRQSAHMRANGWGNYRQWGPKVLNQHFDELFKGSTNIID